MRDDHLLSFVAQARASAAATVRQRSRWLGRQLAEDDTFSRALERAIGATVDVHLCDERRYRGALVAVGCDLLTVRTETGVTVVVAEAVSAVIVTSASDGVADPSGWDDLRTGFVTIADVLLEASALRRRVSVDTSGGGRVSGQVASVGRDVLALAGRSQTWVRLAAVTAVSIPA